MNSFIALSLVSIIVCATATWGIVAVRKIRMDPAEFIVGGRSLGFVLLWILMAGEVYTSFTFLGAAGWAYGKGAAAYYIICYLSLACILAFFYMPAVWRIGRQHRLLTNADFFAHCYASPLLGKLVALVGVVFLIPYVTLQLTGIQILLKIAGYGAIETVWAAGLAFFLIVGFVLVSGLRGTAWASLIKDVLVLGGVLFAGIVLPIHFFGSPQAMLDRLAAERPQWLTLAGGTEEGGVTWFISTVMLTSMGGFIWPPAIAATYSAKSEHAIRRNFMLLPLYQVMLLMVYFAGFTALLVKPGIRGTDADQSFMLIVQEHYPAWVLGFIAAAGCLAALIPAAAQLLAAASLLSHNLFHRRGAGVREKDHPTSGTRWWILLLALFAYILWVSAKTTLVGLLLIGYSGITQLFPGMMLALRKEPPGAMSVATGIIVGLGALVVFAVYGNKVVWGVNVGLVALALNTISLFGSEMVVRWARKMVRA